MWKKVTSFTILWIFDLLVIFLSFALAYLIRRDILPHLFLRFEHVRLYSFAFFLQHFYMALVWIIIFAYEKLYTKRYALWDEIKALVKASTISYSLIMIIIYISRKQIHFSRTIVILAWGLSLLLLPLSRYLVKLFLVKTRLWKKKLFILGVHQTSLLVVKNITKNITMGYEILGFLDDDPKKIGKKFSGVKVLGPLSELENITNTYKSKDLMVATPHLPRRELRELFARCERNSDSMWLIPRTGDFITEGVEIEVLGDVFTLYIKKNLAKPWNILIKNIFDKILTFILITLLSPVFLMIAIAIKMDSRGPIFFIQKRLGQKRKIFKLYKFRSMYMNCDDKLSEYLENNPDSKEEWEKYKKLKNHDPRVTKVGNIIRKYSLDEIPQLFNVIQGRMNLVGPRPYILEELKGNEKFKDTIAQVKPGITGLWQVSGRSELTFEERQRLDEHYIRNWSLWHDVVILFKSAKVLFSSKGAY